MVAAPGYVSRFEAQIESVVGSSGAPPVCPLPPATPPSSRSEPDGYQGGGSFCGPSPTWSLEPCHSTSGGPTTELEDSAQIGRHLDPTPKTSFQAASRGLH